MQLTKPVVGALFWVAEARPELKPPDWIISKAIGLGLLKQMGPLITDVILTQEGHDEYQRRASGK